MNYPRPDPDRLLEALQEANAAARRGKLKLFLGACAGVGKTYAMLQAARQKQNEGVDVLIGIVETHGRADTAALLVGLTTLPSRQVEYRGHLLAEFDLDAALKIKPALIIVDELAHSNVAGSRHQKRWQDVEELLVAGIDVYTAMNVQHLESLNDIVAGITGVKVAETVADHVFDSATDVILVDLPPDELLARLAAGKVYLPDAAQRASKHFFRKGNLIALRELALRRTADRVDAQMRAYRADRAIANVWQARERLLVCIGAGPSSDKLVRSAARLAAKLQADWIVAYVETPTFQRGSKQQRGRILATLKLAEELGAETATLAGTDAAATLAAYARGRNVGKLVIGHRCQTGWRRKLLPGLADQLAERAAELDLYLVGLDPAVVVPAVADRTPPRKIYWRGYAEAVAIVAATSVLAGALLSVFDLANVVMVYLLAVVMIALRSGRGPGALAAFLSVASFDFFFVPPQLTFTVNDSQYLFTFAMMLAVALIIGQLAAKLRFEANVARRRERRADELSGLSRQLSGALTTEQIIGIAVDRINAIFHARSAVLLPDSQERVREAQGGPGLGSLTDTDADVAQWVYDHQQHAGQGSNTLPSSPARYLPLKAPMRTRGVLALQVSQLSLFDEPEEMRLLDTCAAQIALALERVHFVEVAQDALVSMEGERLRNGLLTTVSHDLRTPLTALVGLADTLAGSELSTEVRHELAEAIRDKARSTAELVGKLLDMARLQSGAVTLRRDWQSLEEVLGSARRQLDSVLANHTVISRLPPDLPLCEFDPVLIERVLVNLLENAAKYTPPGSEISILAVSRGDLMRITVDDNGPGLPAGREEKLFGKFERGESESALPGVGLGLAISRAIIEAHGGRMYAENRSEGGARFVFTLPLGTPPSMPDTSL
ncbi:DUF4118 domain-containing protein [Chitinimonas sp. BJB300]|uniref:DUF4118 domain-containing protein n=1 Tax=Chitinimonas sp. BJB300 TaxID=1559339 RepID=UPI000C0C9D94|nr:DUF4118 domain-containing protein [Chitinimonas sp. BJB300]PHV13472.1 two-component system sensor histidine kinase KdbD [Chitinimonas sp. BJB300]TSJ89843.1 DUF4118 domain-containing protein [Chitinimonas sp. BJB300]